jgi:predicted DNA-binding transcriptional regulator AlpA
MARREVTGKKPGVSAGPAEPLAFTIPQFCEAHAISVGMFYKLKKEDKAPRSMRIGSKILIAHEAAAAWRAERTNDVEAHEHAEKVWAEARTDMYGEYKPKPKPAVSVAKPSKIAPKTKRAKLAAEADA